MPWHPVAVHFPIALLSFALVVDLAALMRRRPAWHRLAYALLVAGTLGAAIAVVTGNAAAAPFRESALAAAIQDHEDRGSLAFLAFLVTAMGRLPLFLRRRDGGWALRLWIAAAAVGVSLVGLTSYHGGRLVYDHGVGVRLPAVPGN